MRRIPIALLTLSLALAALPMAAGHAAPPARDFEIRVLHDHSDDSAVVLAGQHGYDTIALDVRPVTLEDGRPALALRLILNGGCNDAAIETCDGHFTETVQFTAGGADRSVLFETSDAGATWSGDAAWYSGPIPLNDGTRFAVEGWVPFEDIGVTVGTGIEDWFVDAVDAMPQGAVPGVPDPTDTAFELSGYTVPDPRLYFALTSSTVGIKAAPGDEVRVPLRVENLLTAEQTLEFRVAGLEGSIMDGDTAITNLSLAPDFAKDLEFVGTMGDADAVLALSAVSALGGYGLHAVNATLGTMAMEPMMFTSSDLLKGGSWSHTFETEGTFEYHNHHDPLAMGTVTVHAAEGEAETHTVHYTRAAGADSGAFDPADLDVHVGDTVTWINDFEDAVMIMGSIGGHMDGAMDGHDHSEHDHTDPHDETSQQESQDAPGPATALVLLGILGTLRVLRRK